MPLLYDGRNILVRGIRSIGKTAFILATLYRLQQDAQARGTPVLPIHIAEFRGGRGGSLLPGGALRVGPGHGSPHIIAPGAERAAEEGSRVRP